MSLRINANPHTQTVRLFASTGHLVAVGNLNPAKQGLLATRTPVQITTSGKNYSTSSVRITGGSVQFFDDTTLAELVRRMLKCYEEHLRLEMYETRLILYPDMSSKDWRMYVKKFVQDDMMVD